MKKVIRTKKGLDKEILALCNPEALWSQVSKDQAIREIEAAGKPHSVNSPYYTEYMGVKALVVVINDGTKGKYLRTDPDKTQRNNLQALPDC